MKKRFSLRRPQYQHLADKLMDSANVLLAALVVGQFVEKTLQWTVVASGFTFYVILVIITTTLRRKG